MLKCMVKSLYATPLLNLNFYIFTSDLSAPSLLVLELDIWKSRLPVLAKVDSSLGLV